MPHAVCFFCFLCFEETGFSRVHFQGPWNPFQMHFLGCFTLWNQRALSDWVQLRVKESNITLLTIYRSEDMCLFLRRAVQMFIIYWIVSGNNSCRNRFCNSKISISINVPGKLTWCLLPPNGTCSLRCDNVCTWCAWRAKFYSLY